MQTTIKHKQEPMVSTHATIAIGCECGWVHSEDTRGYDSKGARERNRAAYRQHKADSATSTR